MGIHNIIFQESLREEVEGEKGIGQTLGDYQIFFSNEPEKQDINPLETVYVGTNLSLLEAAKSRGMRTVGIGPKLIFSDVTGIRQISDEEKKLSAISNAYLPRNYLPALCGRVDEMNRNCTPTTLREVPLKDLLY